MRLNYASHLLLLLLVPAPAVILHLELLLVKVELGEFVVVRHGLDLTLSNGKIRLRSIRYLRHFSEDEVSLATKLVDISSYLGVGRV